MKLPILNRLDKIFTTTLSAVTALVCLVVPFLLIYQFGFPIEDAIKDELHIIYRNLLTLLWFTITTKVIISGMPERKGSNPFFTLLGYAIFTTVTLLILSISYHILQPDKFINAATSDIVVMVLLFSVSASQLSSYITSLLNKKISPPMLLAGSFMVIILIGSLLLKLPNCTVREISYIDSLFISASAVCVTGLTPIDISQTLSTTGMVVLLLLIQIGGLGIMTITSFFGLFFMGGGSFANQVVVSDILSSDQLNDLLKTLAKIIGVTFFIEAIGALLIYISIQHNSDYSTGEALFFGVFHSISAFCNAGFSTLSGNLYDPLVRNLSGIQYTIGVLVICGGIGFPIFSNALAIMAHYLRNLIRRLYGLRPIVWTRLWSLNSYIVVLTTTVLVIGGWAVMLLLEWNHSLAEFSTWDKIAQGFMAAVTPRTAGFSGVDMELMLPSTILFTIILMWIGGAPQSTAGGIKVTTFYLAIKNIFSESSSEKGIVEVKRRQIPASSVRRAFSVIMLSLFVIAVSVMILSLLHPDIQMIHLIFEVVSALSTVGLTLDVTPHLGTYSKVLVILLMFVGRVGLISILAIFIHRRGEQQYSYPKENILIN